MHYNEIDYLNNIKKELKNATVCSMDISYVNNCYKLYFLSSFFV